MPPAFLYSEFVEMTDVQCNTHIANRVNLGFSFEHPERSLAVKVVVRGQVFPHFRGLVVPPRDCSGAIWITV